MEADDYGVQGLTPNCDAIEEEEEEEETYFQLSSHHFHVIA